MLNIKFFYLYFGCFFLISCAERGLPGKSLQENPDVIITISDLQQEEKNKLDSIGCIADYNEVIRRVCIKNNIYDTMWISISDYCKIKQPFLLYSIAEYFNSDTMVSAAFITSSSGYEVPLINSDSILLLLQVDNIQYRHRIYFNAKIDSSGQRRYKKFKFSDF